MRAVGVLAALALGFPAAVPAQAEEAAVWAFAYANVTAQGTVTLDNWAASPGVTVDVDRRDAGDYRVHLVGGAADGVPVVTAVSGGDVHCQVASFASVGRDEVADVACYAGAGRVESAFTFSFFSSTQGDSRPGDGAYGYASSNGAVVYNSAGEDVVVERADSRTWHVRFDGDAFANLAGNAQVTAVGRQPARCGVVDWAGDEAGVEAKVRCDKVTTAAEIPQWTLVYAHERSIVGTTTGLFGYLQADQPDKDVYEPDIRRNRGPNGHIHRITRADTGKYQVSVHGQVKLPVVIHASAGGDSDSFCALTGWVVLVAEKPEDPTARVGVSCYDAGGDPVDSWFTLNYYSPRP